MVHFANMKHVEQSYGHVLFISTISSPKLKYIQQLFHQYFKHSLYEINTFSVVTVIYINLLFEKNK